MRTELRNRAGNIVDWIVALGELDLVAQAFMVLRCPGVLAQPGAVPAV